MLSKFTWDNQFDGALDILGLKSRTSGVLAELSSVTGKLLVDLKAHGVDAGHS